MKKNIPTFPIKGIFGSNILHEEHKIFNGENEYSMKAFTSPGFLLTVKLKGEGELSWSFSMSKRNGWFVETFNSIKKEQIFKMDEDSKAEIALNIVGKGRMVIELYQNSEIHPFDSREIVFS